MNSNLSVIGNGLLPLCNLLLIFLIAKTVALATWQLVWPPSPSSLAPTSPPLSPVDHGVLPYIEDTAVMPPTLFGQANTHQPVRPDMPRHKTWRLLGIVYGTTHTSRALISHSGHRERVYQTGDHLPGGAQLTAIFPDYVIIQQQQRREKIHLPKASEQPPPTLLANRGGTAYLAPPINAEVTRHWNRLRQRPEEILQMVQLKPTVQNGRFVGITLLPGKNRLLLQRFGLQPGDLITWVNGVELTDPLKGMALVGQLATAEAVHLRLQRGTTSHQFDFYRQGNEPAPPSPPQPPSPRSHTPE